MAKPDSNDDCSAMNSRLLWLTRGRRAGTFGEFPNAQADEIVAAGMGQDVGGKAVENLGAFEVTDTVYPGAQSKPIEPDPQPVEADPQPSPAKPPRKAKSTTRQSRATGSGGAKPARGRHARRDIRPEE